MPGEPFDAPENLPKEGPGQGTLGKLEHEVPRMPDQAPAAPEDPLLEARQGQSLDGDGQNQPTQQSGASQMGDPPGSVAKSALPTDNLRPSAITRPWKCLPHL
jgi:hypothetical protein